MCGYREPTQEDVDKIAKSLSDGIYKRLRAGKSLTSDQQATLLAAGVNPSKFVNEILAKAKGVARSMGLRMPEDAEEDLSKGSSRPSWALDASAYWQAVQMAQDKGKSGDWYYVKRLYKRLAAGERFYSEDELTRAAANYL